MSYSQCQDCQCYCPNWDSEVRETMKQAPGEECSNGLMPWRETSYPCYQPIEE